MGVSLSQVLGSETPETPQPKRVSIETIGPQDSADEEIVPSRDDAEETGAAVAEYQGEIPRAWAEGFARLNPDRRPGDAPPRRWPQFIDDIGRFLDGSWAEKAASLGWGPLDLFGCDRARPFARIDHAGLLWLLNGDRLVELDRHRAVIETRTGARQTFRRRPFAVGDVVLAWELAE
jgi:hypothetical protein